MVKFALLIFIAYLAVGAIFYAAIMDHWTVREALCGVVRHDSWLRRLCPKGDSTKVFAILSRSSASRSSARCSGSSASSSCAANSS